MPEAIGNTTAGVPIKPTSGGVEETAQRERSPSAEQREQQRIEEERARRTEEAAAQETGNGRTVNTSI